MVNSPRDSEQGCNTRLGRLLRLIETSRCDAAILTDCRDIYYFTGVLLPADLPSLVVAEADGSISMIAPEETGGPKPKINRTYTWNSNGTRDPEPIENMLTAAAELHRGRSWKRVGVRRNCLLDSVKDFITAEAGSEIVAFDQDLASMQSRKDPDEVEILRKSIAFNLGAYAAVQASIAPGVSELVVLAAGIRGAMLAAGEKVYHDGDYQSGAYNGPARNRLLESGELYIVDAWTCYRGYWADMSRTFVVGREPSELQHELFEHIRFVLLEIAKLLRPGIDGCELFSAMDDLIRLHPPLADQGLIHHGGHAIGLRAHEMPDVNRDRGGVLQSGNVICIEPGGYFPAANYGVRLENMYLISDNGCEALCPGELLLQRCG